MKKQMIKYCSILLIFCLIFTNVTYGWEIADANSNLPAGIPYKNKNNYRLNLTLFWERGLQVYGTPEDIENNDFKVGSNTTLAGDNSKDIKNAGW